LNELRLSDHARLLEQEGFRVRVVSTEQAQISALDALPLEPRFQAYDPVDLRTTRAVIAASLPS
jgi:hypothetical protein